MNKNKLNNFANKRVNAFLKNKIISPLPLNITKKISHAQKFKNLCESKIKKPIIGFKAGGTSIPVLKKLNEKEPFYASVYSHNFLKNGSNAKVNKYKLGIELEVCYLINKNFFKFKNIVTSSNIKKFITHIAPCIEVVGYRQRKKGIKFLGDLCSDFGGNVKFIIGSKIKYKNQKVDKLKTNISNNKLNYSINGNTNTVYKNPLNSLKFVLNKLKKDKIDIKNNFFVFTGSTVGVAPITGKGFYTGKIEKLGSVRVKII